MNIAQSFSAGRVAGLIIVTVLTLNYLGFCYSRGVIMSDDAYIEAAINNRLHSLDLRGQYASAKEFRAKYPNCCRVERFSGDNTSNWLFAPLFIYQVTVEVSYPLVSLGGVLEQYYAYVLVTKCGRSSFDKGIGMRIKGANGTPL